MEVIGPSLGCLSHPALPPAMLFKFPVVLSPQPGLGWQADVLGCSWGSCIYFLWKTSRVALGAFWPVLGEWLSPSSPHCPPCLGKAFLVLVPLSPEGKAGHSAQCLTHPWSLSHSLIHGPGLSASPSSAAVLPSPLQYVNHIFMQHGMT